MENTEATNIGYARNPAIFAENLPLIVADFIPHDSSARSRSGYMGCWMVAGKEMAFNYWYIGGKRKEDLQKYRLGADWSGAAAQAYHKTLPPKEQERINEEVDRLSKEIFGTWND